MASGTIDLLVFPFQGKMRFAVVEFFYPGQRAEGLLDMALLAVCPQVSIVRIAVAGVTIIGSYLGKLLKYFSIPDILFMAFGTIDRFMLPQKGKIRFIMVKLRRRRKSGCGVAFGAIVGQGFLMHILMTGDAILVQPQIGIASFFQLPVFHQIGFMALPAVNFFVRPAEFEPGEVVIEFVFIKPDNIKIPAVMVAVADGAVFPFGFPRRVKAGPAVHPGLYFFMTIQAFFIRDFIAQNVAFRTIEYPLQIGMCLRQVARRYLRFQAHGQKTEQEDNM